MGPAGSGGLGDGHCTGCLVLPTLLWLREASFLAVSGVHHFVEELTPGRVFFKAQGQPLLGAGVISGCQIHVWASVPSIMPTRLAAACPPPALQQPRTGREASGPAPPAEWGPRARGGGPAAGSPVVGTSCGHSDGTVGGVPGGAPSRVVSAVGAGAPGLHFLDACPLLHSASCGAFPLPFGPTPDAFHSAPRALRAPSSSSQSAAPLAPPRG